MNGKRQKTSNQQLLLAFAEEGRDEVPDGSVEGTVPVAATLTNTECRGLPYDLVLDGPWVFAVASTSLHIFKARSRLTAPLPYAVVPLGFGLLAFRFAQVFYQLATGQKAALLGDEVKDALKLRQDEPTNGGKS